MTKQDKRTPIQSQDADLDFIKSLASEVNATLKRDAIQIGDSGGDDGVPYWIRTNIPQLDFAVGGTSHPGFPGSLKYLVVRVLASQL